MCDLKIFLKNKSYFFEGRKILRDQIGIYWPLWAWP